MVHGGVFVGDVAVAIVKLTDAPAVLADPGAGVLRRIGVELGHGDGVVPAHHSDGVVGVGVSGGDVADIAALAALIVADVAGAVGHDGALDRLNIGAGDPFGVLHMADVVFVGVFLVQTVVRRRRVAVFQSVFGLVGGAGPAHQRIGGHLAVAALIHNRLDRGGLIAGQHILCVIGIGVVEPAVLRLGKVQVKRCGAAAAVAHGDAVLDHVALDAGHGGMGPAGAVGALILDRGDVAVVAAVILAGKGISGGVAAGVALVGCAVAGQVRVGHGFAGDMGGGNVAEIGDLLHPGLRLLLPLNSRGCNREQAQEHCKAQKHCSQLLKLTVHRVFSFFLFLGNGQTLPWIPHGCIISQNAHNSKHFFDFFVHFAKIFSTGCSACGSRRSAGSHPPRPGERNE